MWCKEDNATLDAAFSATPENAIDLLRLYSAERKL